ncbi:hypothetical protein HN777_02065, partial [Candidatus Woesearchaeota archaeon]|nr:hypothetical protein [Candidatus Woesearchaeota archaeon]
MQSRKERTVFLFTMLLMLGAFLAGQLYAGDITGAATGEAWDFEGATSASDYFQIVKLSIDAPLINFIISFIMTFAIMNYAASKAFGGKGGYGDESSKAAMSIFSLAGALLGAWYYSEVIVGYLAFFITIMLAVTLLQFVSNLKEGDKSGYAKLALYGAGSAVIGLSMFYFEHLGMKGWGAVITFIGFIMLIIGIIGIMKDWKFGDSSGGGSGNSLFGGNKNPDPADNSNLGKEPKTITDIADDDKDVAGDIIDEEKGFVKMYKAIENWNFNLASAIATNELRDIIKIRDNLKREYEEVANIRDYSVKKAQLNTINDMRDNSNRLRKMMSLQTYRNLAVKSFGKSAINPSFIGYLALMSKISSTGFGKAGRIKKLSRSPTYQLTRRNALNIIKATFMPLVERNKELLQAKEKLEEGMSERDRAIIAGVNHQVEEVLYEIKRELTDIKVMFNFDRKVYAEIKNFRKNIIKLVDKDASSNIAMIKNMLKKLKQINREDNVEERLGKQLVILLKDSIIKIKALKDFNLKKREIVLQELTAAFNMAVELEKEEIKVSKFIVILDEIIERDGVGFINKPKEYFEMIELQIDVHGKIVVNHEKLLGNVLKLIEN